MSPGSSDLLSGLLKDVSRSFYLTLRVLPGGIRPQISLAYLLARASDTIADTDAISKERRVQVLTAFRESIYTGAPSSFSLDQLAGQQSSASERVLLQRVGEALAVLRHFSAWDQTQIRQVLDTIISGQLLDVSRFAEATMTHVVALETEAQLDDYTYRVAGCVGEFWTRMSREHLFPRADLDNDLLIANGVRFGKGLQLVNILRDLALDLRGGRCYLPAEQLQAVGLNPSDLLNPGTEPRVRPCYNRHLRMAEEHLAAGWAYTVQLPRKQVRVRLACAWPILIGAQTLDRLRREPVLNPGCRIKISRADIRRILFRSVLSYPSARKWAGLLDSVRRSHQKPLPQAPFLAK